MNPETPKTTIPSVDQTQPQVGGFPPQNQFDITKVLGTDRARKVAEARERSPYSFLRKMNEQRDMMFGGSDMDSGQGGGF